MSIVPFTPLTFEINTELEMLTLGGGGMMMFSNGGYRGPKPIKYLFVDGGCLTTILQDVERKYPPFEASNFEFKNLIGIFNKTFYYDSLPPKKNGEDDKAFTEREDKQSAFFDSLRTIDGVHVYEGDARRRRKRVEQKKVDIMIAVDMLTHSFRRNMNEATLLTADLDFKPLIDALVQDGMHVNLWYPHGKPNKELIYASDGRRPLTFDDIYSWCSDDYRKANPIPSALSKPKQEINGTRVDKWISPKGIEVEMFEVDGLFKVVYPSEYNKDKNHHIYISHSDRSLLKRYVQECRTELWKTPI